MDSLDMFGELVMHDLRDRALDDCDELLKGRCKAPSVLSLQRALGDMTADQQEVVRRTVRCCVDGAIHDFLFALQEAHDLETGIAVLVDGVNVAEESDGLHGELFTEDGWQATFSKHGMGPDEE